MMINVAFATDNGKTFMDRHFGDAKFYDVYEISENASKFIKRKEPSVPESVRSGADITCFSGDKLLGGLQAGLIVGTKEFVARIKRNPVYRAMRVDKVVFSAMEVLLRYYLDGNWKENICHC